MVGDRKLYVGFDVGGSSTRCTVIDIQGRRRGSGLAGPGNPTTVSAHDVSVSLLDAFTQTVAAAERSDIAHVTVGAAGITPGAPPPSSDPLREIFVSAVRFAGVHTTVDVLSDLEIAFAAGTSVPSGCLLLAGTGAVAARIDNRLVTRTVDGHGFLYGDAGSGYWLGQQALRHAFRSIDGRDRTGRLSQALIARVLPDAPADPKRRQWALLRAASTWSATAVAGLAELVLDTAADGDRQAVAIVEQAAHHLAESFFTLQPVASDVTVLAGSLLTEPTALARSVHTLLDTRSSTRMLPSRDTAGAAAWLSLSAATGPAVAAPAWCLSTE